MPPGTIIMLVVIALAYIVSAIVQAKIKKQEEEARRQRLEARSSQTSARQRTGTASSSGQPITEASPAASRADTLAARRRAQLEELRRRREAEGGGSAATQSRPAEGAPPRQSQGTRRTSAQASFEAGERSWGERVSAERVPIRMGQAGSPSRTGPVPKSQPPARSGTRASQPSPPTSPTQQPTRRPSRRPDESSVFGDSPILGDDISSEEIGAARTREEPEETPQSIGGESSLIHDLKLGKVNRVRLREAIVLKELLDPPIALR